MTLLLRSLATASCIYFMAMSSLASANQSISEHTGGAATDSARAQSHFVQIFSSINATKAEGMKNTLEMQGYPAFIKIQAKTKLPCYQVQIGPFRSKRLAYNAKSSIVQRYPQYPFLNEAILKIAF